MRKVDAIRLKLEPNQETLQNNRECTSIPSDSDLSDRTTNESSSALSSQRSSKDIEAAYVEKKEPSVDVKTALERRSPEDLKRVLSYFNQLQKLESEIVSLLETRKGETDLYRSIRAVSMQPTFEKAADIEQKMMSLLFPSQHLQYRSIKKGIEDWLMIQECLQEDLTAEIIKVKASDSSVLQGKLNQSGQF